MGMTMISRIHYVFLYSMTFQWLSEMSMCEWLDYPSEPLFYWLRDLYSSLFGKGFYTLYILVMTFSANISESIGIEFIKF